MSNEREGQADGTSPIQGTEAEQKGGHEPAHRAAERDWEDSPKESGE